MKVIAIILDKHPETPTECPFYYGDRYDPYCVMGGKCKLRFNRFCKRLTVPFEPCDDGEYDWDEDED